MEDRRMVELIDEDGQAVQFEIVVDFEVEGQEYAVLVQEGSEEEAILFRVVEDGGDEPSFEVVIDDAEFEAVAKVYEEIMNQE